MGVKIASRVHFFLSAFMTCLGEWGPGGLLSVLGAIVDSETGVARCWSQVGVTLVERQELTQLPLAMGRLWLCGMPHLSSSLVPGTVAGTHRW